MGIYRPLDRCVGEDIALKATLRLKLHTCPAVDAALHETLRQSTACFNAVCRHGWDHHERNGTRLHQSTYRSLRQLYDRLPSQLVISARMKAAEALKSVSVLHKRGKKISCPQSELCPIRYDARSYWVKLEEGVASLATVCSRVAVSFRLPSCYQRYLTWDTCSADLCWDGRKKRFYLHVVVDTDAPPLALNGKVVGCDLGVNRIAVTSTPQFFSSAQMHARVRQYEHLRSSLQAKGTRSAKRHLQKVSRRWTRFQACHNHRIANAILAPLVAGNTLAIEDLTGIRERCRHRKKQRGRFHRWSFAQLGDFLTYKAERQGILVIQVDPALSSRTCHKCGHCEKKNRKSQSQFVCQVCGYRSNADFNAAHNLRQRGTSLLIRLMSDSQSQPTAPSASFAQAPGKAIYDESGGEEQRAANSQALAGSI
ncbi:MAG: ISSoc1, transposase [Chthonomonadaceae bacterium]|nr:ISSoc1, transposase [Chthonomonadaceae bacterium]